ncbi:MAG TPA: radical SAM protein [Anaerovoracaceae bacterium]|nr:radical SAM protein [Anaerovoracaceae bacterium]
MTVATKKAELENSIAKYPDFSPFAILKLSLELYGVRLTQRTLDAVQNKKYSFGTLLPTFVKPEVEIDRELPGQFLLRDATTLSPSLERDYDDPYIIDWDGENFVIRDSEEFVDTVDFVPRPKYFGKKTSRGVPMEAIALVRAQRMVIHTYTHCDFWNSKSQCRYCAYFTDAKDSRQAFAEAELKEGKVGKRKEANIDDIYEMVREALKEPGLLSTITLTGGTQYSGEEVFDDDVNRYIRILKAVGRNFKGRFPSQVIAPAYSKKQVKRLYDETGLTSYAPNIEVWGEELFNWLCPGKSKWPGYREWIKRTIDAVEIFGKGNVYTQTVSGVELAKPYGFKSIDEALESNFEACEFYSKNGVVFLSTFWSPHKYSVLGKQPLPPLEFYIRLADGLYRIRKEYGLHANQRDYKHSGGNHVDSELERAD